ncbi:hypothetical protein PM082_011832 [Marasmius tenuissimus]|nr:hypothetical protein PM082_011832 [Marasmius tenuissimus]
MPIIALPLAILGLFKLFGFGPLGPIAGTLATAIQSTFYGGQTCGLFSIAQSISMTGILVGWPIGGTLTGLVVAAIGGIRLLRL